MMEPLSKEREAGIRRDLAEDLLAEIDRLRAKNDEQLKAIADLGLTYDELTSENDRLRAALREIADTESNPEVIAREALEQK